MKNAAECAKNLAALLSRLPEAAPADLPDQDDPVSVLVMSFLMWESSTARALAAYERLRERTVDFNDLRVCMSHEAADYIGDNHALGLERCQRLRATLRNIFLREHAVNLDRLAGAGKREVRKYIESLEGIVPYVAARVMLLSFETHAIPVDEQLRAQLVAAGAADESATVADVSVWLSRQIKAGDGRATHFALQAWIDKVGGKVPTARKGAGKKKKKTSARGAAGKAGGRKKSSSSAASRGSSERKTAGSGTP